MLSLTHGMSRVRPPAVAGLFYPDEPAELTRLVESCISAAPPRPGGRAPRALIVPHSSYAYSGAVAGQAYRALRDSGAHPARVVVAGPSHRVPMRGLAVSSLDAFETPLGTIPVDVEACQRLRQLGLVGLADEPHAAEHSIEVQLPFLQVVLGKFTLLPLAIGLAPPGQVARALDAAWSDPDTLLVLSSDLSHHHTCDEARKLDAGSGRSILDRRDDLSDEQACGARGINGLMQLARRRGLRVELLDLRNSGDTAGDRSRVVGYGSYALYDA
jgi:AmmeMemoRadiSam system protein B